MNNVSAFATRQKEFGKKYFPSERVGLLIAERFPRTAAYETLRDWSVCKNDVSLPPRQPRFQAFSPFPPEKAWDQDPPTLQPRSQQLSNEVAVPILPTSPCCRFTTKTNMADESSDEEQNVQNGYDGELEHYLAGNSGSDNSDSAGNFMV